MENRIFVRIKAALLTAKSPLGATALAALLLSTTLPGPLSPAHAASTAKPLMFGASGSSRALVEAHERVLGQKLRGLRVYKQWDDALFTSSQTWARDTGHTLFMSISSERNNGSKIKWADIARAQPGSPLFKDMQRQAQQVKAFGARVYIAFDHEPETESTRGTPAEFAAAWRKWVTVWRAAGVQNARYVWTMTAYGFKRNDNKRAELYYPGDSYVDHIAADGYNWGRCRDAQGGWVELSSVIEGHRQFGKRHPTKGLMLWEFGSTEDPAHPGRKAQWFRNATALFKKPGYRQYKAVLTWEGRNYPGGGGCKFDYASSRSATDAWVDMAKDSAYEAVTL